MAERIRLTRRSVVGAVAVAILWPVSKAKEHFRQALVSRTAPIDPRAFGARFDGRTDDTAAWQAAINLAAATGIPLVVSQAGTSVVTCRPMSRGTYGHDPAVAVYQALDINHSRLNIDLGGSRLLVRGHGISNAVNYAFGTAKNLQPATLRGIHVRNGTLDFDPTGDPSINKRSFYLVGVEGVVIEDLVLTSSGRRAGATITLQNCRTVVIRNVRGINVTQGMNLSYVEDVVLESMLFERFREAIDCDRKVTRLVARDLTFRGGGPTCQCLDLNSVVDVLVSGVRAHNVGNIALVNYKTTTQSTYAEYVRNELVTAYSPSQNVTIENVRADRICFPTSTTRPFILGNDQAHQRQSSFPLENITIRDVVLTNCPSFIPIELVTNAVLANVVFEGAVNPVPGRGCIDIRSDYTGTRTSAVLRNVTVKMGSAATTGIRAGGVASVELENVAVVGASTPKTVFFDFVNLERNGAVVRLQEVSARMTGGASGVAYKFGGRATDGKRYSIMWGDRNCASGEFKQRIVTNGNAAERMDRVPRLFTTCQT